MTIVPNAMNSSSHLFDVVIKHPHTTSGLLLCLQYFYLLVEKICSELRVSMQKTLAHLQRKQQVSQKSVLQQQTVWAVQFSVIPELYHGIIIFEKFSSSSWYCIYLHQIVQAKFVERTPINWC